MRCATVKRAGELAGAVILVIALVGSWNARAEEKKSYNGRSLDEWITRLNDTSKVAKLLRIEASEAIPHFGVTAVAPLLQNLNDGTGEIRVATIGVLGRIGPDAKDAVPKLIEFAKNSEDKLAIAATQALGNIGTLNAEVQDLLLNGTRAKSQGVVAASVLALGGVKCRDVAAVDRLFELLKREADLFVTPAVIRTIGMLDLKTEAAYEAITQSIQAKGPGLQLAALDAIELISDISPHLQTLVAEKARESPEAAVKQRATDVLKRKSETKTRKE